MVTLANKILFISGMGSGIGLATAQAATELGAQVCGTVFSEEQASSLQDSLPAASVYQADVTNADELCAAVDKAASQHGRLDGMVACAGVLALQTTAQTDMATWQKILDTNLTGAFHLAKAVMPHLKKQPGGSMVFVSSQIGFVGHPRAAAYAASKAGLNGLTRSIALELASEPIRVNAVAPGPVISDMTEAARSDDKRYEQMLADIPLGRFGEAAEIANVITFLLSEASSFITGQVIIADGGFTAR